MEGLLLDGPPALWRMTRLASPAADPAAPSFSKDWGDGDTLTTSSGRFCRFFSSASLILSASSLSRWIRTPRSGGASRECSWRSLGGPLETRLRLDAAAVRLLERVRVSSRSESCSWSSALGGRLAGCRGDDCRGVVCVSASARPARCRAAPEPARCRALSRSLLSPCMPPRPRPTGCHACLGARP